MEEYLFLERKVLTLGKGKEAWDGVVPWRFTPIDWLEKKLNLASMYSENIINWGYYPFMTPNPMHGFELKDQRQAYQDYKAYYEKVINR